MRTRGSARVKGRDAVGQPLVLGQYQPQGLFLNLVAELRSTFLGSFKCLCKCVFLLAAMVLLTTLMFLYVLPRAHAETNLEALPADAKDFETFRTVHPDSGTLSLPEPARDQQDASNSKSGNLLNAVQQDDMFSAYGLGLQQITASRTNGSSLAPQEPKQDEDHLEAHRPANEDELHNSSRAAFDIEDYLRMPRAMLDYAPMSDQLKSNASLVGGILAELRRFIPHARGSLQDDERRNRTWSYKDFERFLSRGSAMFRRPQDKGSFLVTSRRLSKRKRSKRSRSPDGPALPPLLKVFSL